MSATIADVSISKGTWVDLYAGSGIAVGTAVTVVNKGTRECIVATGVAAPVDSVSGVPLYIGPNGSFLNIPASEAGLWAYCSAGTSSLSVQPSAGVGSNVTANAGTNLNTSLLALESGGNLASIKAKTDNLDVALSTRLKPADTLAGVTAVGSITNSLPSGSNVIGKFGIDQTTDGTTNKVNLGVTVATAGADAESNTANKIPVISWLKSFNGTTWDRVASGLVAVQTTFTGILNTLPMARYNSSAPTLSTGNVAPLQSDVNGNLKVNIGVYNGTPGQTTVAVATSSTSILASNATRSYLSIQNQDATNPIWISFIGAATATAACLKIAAGASVTYDSSFIPSTAVTGISTGGTVNICVVEGS